MVFGRPCNTVSITFLKMEGVEDMPHGSRVYQNNPRCVFYGDIVSGIFLQLHLLVSMGKVSLKKELPCSNSNKNVVRLGNGY